MRAYSKSCIQAAGFTALTVVLATGCVNGSWQGAKKKETVGYYHQFLRDHPNSRFADEARERMAFLRVKSLPTLKGYEEFESVYPESTLTTELQGVVEPLYFEAARNENTEAAYQQFIKRYPAGEHNVRAQGNLFYIRDVRNNPSVQELRAFLDANPESDFAAEAQSTLALLDSRKSTQIQLLGVRVDVSPNVVQAERVRRGFVSVVAKAYRPARVRVAMISPGEGPSSDMDAWMRVDYHEAPASGTFGGSTLLSHCRVRLYHKNIEEPIWDRKFDAPADHILKGAYGRDKTVFGNSKYRFWEEFFVPVSTWAASQSRIKSLSWLEPVKNIHVRGDRAAVLLERGGVDFVDVSIPLEPEVRRRYRRQSDLSSWSGVHILDARHTLIFGGDGAELLKTTDLGIDRIARWDASELGSINAVSPYDEHTVFMAGEKGLYALRLGLMPITPHRLLDGNFIGVKAEHPYVVAIRPDKVEVGTAKHLLRHLTGTKLPLGRFRGKRVRVLGDSIYIFGKGHIAEVDVTDPSRPRVASLISTEDVGEVTDVARSKGNLYLLGARGFQVATPKADAISDSIQVNADSVVESRGRFAFLVGGKELEVLDLTPYQELSGSVPAAQDE